MSETLVNVSERLDNVSERLANVSERLANGSETLDDGSIRRDNGAYSPSSSCAAAKGVISPAATACWMAGSRSRTLASP
jgi:hypothetical protein